MHFFLLLILLLVSSFNDGYGRILHELELSKLKKFYSIHDPDIDRNVSGLISTKGYPVEEHTVKTDDGFVLSLQRIPHGREAAQKNGKKQVVLLQHGLLSASSDFVLNFPEQSLGFILADAGYEVWLGNTRGNIYSNRHVKYSPDDYNFWDFSFDEMARYDLPAMIDYILRITGQEKIFYIGHSQGTTVAFAMLSENPAYNKKIKLFIALAPVVTGGHMTTPLTFLAPFEKELSIATRFLGIKEFSPTGPILRYLAEHICESKAKMFCHHFFFQLFEIDSTQLNKSRIPVYLTHFPSGSSTKSVVHFAQLINSNRFQKYDYGIFNYIYYGQNSPPEYDVSQIKTPVALMWSTNDELADPADVLALQHKLLSLVTSYEVPYPEFNHFDFIIAINAKQFLHDEILELLRKHSRD